MKPSAVLALTSITFFTSSASGQSQSPANRPDSTAAVSGSRTGRGEHKDAPNARDLEREIDAVRAENAEVRALLHMMEEQQKLLLEQVERLQKRLDVGVAPDLAIANQPALPTT